MAKKKKKGDDEEEEKGGGKMKIIGGVVGAVLVYRFVLAPAPAPVPVDGEAAAPAVEREVELVEGLIFPMEEIVERVWGYEGDGNRDLVRGLIRRVRRKIEMETSRPRYIHNLPGVGYQFTPE